MIIFPKRGAAKPVRVSRALAYVSTLAIDLNA